MATFFDIGILDNFSIIFIFLLVYAVVFAVLQYSSIFGKESKGLYGIMALAIAIMVSLSKAAVLILNVMTPWFVILFFFIFFMIFAVRMWGASEADTVSIIKNKSVYPWIIVFAGIIMIGSIASAFGQGLLEKGTGSELGVNADDDPTVLPGDIEGGSTKTTSFGSNVLNTIFHPKVLGLIAIMLIGLFSIIFLSSPT